MWFLYLLIFYFGASVFSFLNVIIYRLPRNIDFIKGRSFCPSCQHELSFFDMMPMISYMVLGGKCRYCKSEIGYRDTLVELLGGILAIMCYFKRDLLSFLFLCVLCVVCFIDMDTMIIPDGCSIAILILGMVSMVLKDIPLLSRCIGLVCVSVPMMAICLIIPGGFGGGDMKLMGAAGFFTGWKVTLIATVIATLLGGFYGIYLIVLKKAKKNSHFAFGPFLCLGLAISLFYSTQILNWYLSFILF